MSPKNDKQKIVKKTEKEPFLKKYAYEAIIFFFALLLFANSIPNDYNMDDELVTKNHRLTSKGISAIPEIFTSSYYKDNMGYAYEYRPVVLSSFAVEHQLFGDNPQVSHFFNVLLYGFCCLLVFLVLTNLSDRFHPTLSFIATLVFVTHPSHTEVVSSIKNRDEILGLIFCLLTFLVAIKAAHRTRWMLLLMLPIIFALALMNKVTFLPFAVIIPLGLMLFTKASMTMILVTSVALAVPSFYLINTGNFADKVFICVGIVIAPLFQFFVIRFQIVFDFFQKLKTENIFKSVEQGNINSKNEDSLEGFNGFFTNLSVPPNNFSFYAITTAFVVILAYVNAIVFELVIFELIIFLLLIVLAGRGNEKWSWWANVLIYGCLTLSRSIWNDDLLVEIVSIALCYHVFFGDRRLRVATSVLLLINITWSAYFYSFEPLLFAVVFFGLRTRMKWFFGGIFIILLAASLIFDSPGNFMNSVKLYSYQHSTKWLIDYLGLPIAILIVAILLRKTARYFVWVWWAMAIFFLISNQILIAPKSSPGNLKNRIEVLGKDLNANIINEKQDRPISFIEQPISGSDSWQIKVGTSMRVLFHYFIKTIIPYPLSFYYGYKFIAPEEITKLIPLLSVLIHLLLIGVSLYFLRHNTVVFFGIAIYLASIVTFANYFAPIPGIVGDRYLLIPSIGWSIILAVFLFRIWKANTKEKDFNSKTPKGLKYSLGFILCFYSFITVSRNFQWKDSLRLFRHDISYVDNSAMAHNLLAIHLMQASEKEINIVKQTELKKEALAHFKRAQEIYPKFFNVAYDIGRVYLSLNMEDSAVNAFKYAIQVGSDYIMVYKNLTDLLFSKGRYEEAIPYLKYLIADRPVEFTAYDRLSFIYFKKGEYENSIAVNKKAMQQLPQQVDPVFNIGRTYLEINQIDSARHYLLRANEMSPGNSVVQQLLQQTDNP